MAGRGVVVSGPSQREGRFGLTLGSLVVLAIIVAIFASSVFFRLSYLDKPMGLHHEEGTARTLVHSISWWEEGPSAGGFIMSRTLTSPGDKHIAADAADDGNLYYYSFPPGHPLLAFGVHRAIGYEPTVMSVRVLNLILGFLSASMVYLIVRELLKKLPTLWSRFAGVVSFTLYVFTPVGLWYHSNAFTSASAVQPFFLAALLAATYAYRPSQRHPWLIPSLFGGAVFAMSYIEWLGPAMAAVTVVLWLFRRDDAILRRLAIAASIGAVGALGLTAIQYSISMGAAQVVDYVAGRFVLRSGVSNSGWSMAQWAAWEKIFVFASISFAFLAVFALVLWLWDRLLSRGKAKGFTPGDAPISTILALSIAPALLHHLVLFNHTAVHDFDMLKTTVFLVLAAGVLIGRLLARSAAGGEEQTWLFLTVISVLVCAVVAGSLYGFQDINGKLRDEPRALGAAIREEANDDEVVFLDTTSYLPPATITYYGGRNYVDWVVESDASAAILAAGGDERTGVLFWLDEHIGVVAIGYVGTDGIVYESRAEAKATLDMTEGSK